MATNLPREVCSAVSVAQTGTIALRIPVPQPLTKRATESQRDLQKDLEYLTHDHPCAAHSGSLKTGPKDSPGRAETDGLDTSIFITEPATNETTDKGSNVVDAHDPSF